MWDYLAARMQEPSTWVSLGSMLTGIGLAIAPEYWQAITAIGLGFGGLFGTVMRERAKTTTEIKEVVRDTVQTTAIKPGER